MKKSILNLRNNGVTGMKTGLVFLLIAIMLITTACTSSDNKEAKELTKMRKDISTTQLVREMGVGINLGNTFESSGGWIEKSVKGYETAWGSPVVTEDLIKGYAEAGFGVLRVPVAWSNLMEENYVISQDYLDRVKEVVRWALKTDMYVILNIHWDGGWWENFADEKDESMKKYKSIWNQLTDEFGVFGDKLMFESLNEEGYWEEIWNRYSGSTEGKAESYALLNEINQTFVDIVRGSKGNNKNRHLLIAGMATDFELTSDPLFEMPNDPKNRCAVSVHYYTPPTFAILEKDASWGAARTTWGTDEDIAELNMYMDMVKERFVDNGIPVIVGEFGVSTRNKTEEMIRKYMTSVNEAIYSRNMCPVVWDITDVFYDRTTFKMKDTLLLEGLMAVKEKYE